MVVLVSAELVVSRSDGRVEREDLELATAIDIPGEWKDAIARAVMKKGNQARGMTISFSVPGAEFQK